MYTDAGVELNFSASHATREQAGPHLYYRFSKAVVTFHQGDGHMTVRYTDGTTHRLDDMQDNKIADMLSFMDGGRQLCSVRAAAAQTAVIQAAHQASIQTFSDACIEQPTDDGHLVVKGLGEEMLQAFREHRRPHHQSLVWSDRLMVEGVG